MRHGNIATLLAFTLAIFSPLPLARTAPPDEEVNTLFEEGRKNNNYQFTGGDPDVLAAALDPKWEGPLPYSILVAPGGEIIFRHTGEVDPVELKTEIVKYLGRFYTKPAASPKKGS